MVNCPYLIYDSSHCAACTGWFCNVFGRKKRLTDTSMCVNNEDWILCTRYTRKSGTVKEPEPEPEEEVIELPPTKETTTFTAFIGDDVETIKVNLEPEAIEVEVPPPAPSTDCPYLEADPVGAKCCSGFHCRAINVPLRAFKICKVPPFHECQRYQKAVKYGVK